jgi:hypothetical protein
LWSRCHVINRKDSHISRAGLVRGIVDLKSHDFKTPKTDFSPIANADVSAGVDAGRVQLAPAHNSFV